METILVIEDDKSVRDNIILLLEAEGYEVTSASNGMLATILAKDTLPDLIICDIMMPQMDGYEVLRNLRKIESTQNIPFIFLTAKVGHDDMRKGMELGADDYLFKPFKASELLKAINARLQKAKTIKTNKSGTKKTLLDINDSLFIDSGNKAQFIKVKEIKFIAAVNQYSRLELVNGKNVLLKRSLNAWEKKLGKGNFVRIHRSTIVNLNFVKKVEKLYNGSFRIQIQDYPEFLSISRRHASEIRQLF